jgi:hypothetical protein
MENAHRQWVRKALMLIIEMLLFRHSSVSNWEHRVREELVSLEKKIK